MHVTTKGQVTIPQYIREKYGIMHDSEVDFIEDGGRVYIVKVEKTDNKKNKFKKARGCASVKMSTDEIMAFTRGG